MDIATQMELCNQFGIVLGRDFHALNSDQVERIIAAADSVKYRKPKSANGSRARYFYQALQRAHNRRCRALGMKI